MNGSLESKYFHLEKVTEGAFAAVVTKGAGAQGNAGIVDLGDETLVFDTFVTPEAASDLRRVAEQVTGHPVSFVVNSHYHWDHAFGNQVFADATIISTGRTRDLMITGLQLPEGTSLEKELVESLRELEEQIQKETNELRRSGLQGELADRSKLVAALPDIKLTLPMMTFDKKLVVHGSRRSVEIVSLGGGHTESDAFIHLIGEGIVFAGDLLFVEAHAWMGNGDPENWMSILKHLKSMNLFAVVPGHGGIGTVEDIDRMMDYLMHVQEVVRRAIAEKRTLTEIITMEIPQPFRGWRSPYVYEWNLETLYQRWSEPEHK